VYPARPSAEDCGRQAVFTCDAIVHNLAEAITFNGAGRWGDAKRSIERVLARLDAGKSWFTSEQEHCDLLTGALLLKGINSSYREHPDALDCAKRLEGLGTQQASAAAMRVCMTYHLCRAELQRRDSIANNSS
jgi:hypothetical protein